MLKKYSALLLFVFFFFTGFYIFNNIDAGKKYILESPLANLKQKQLITFSKNESKNYSLSVENIFNENHDWVKNFPEKNIITLIATGDVIPARSVNYKTIQYQNFKWPFEKTAEILKKGDITLINLESPLVSNCTPTNTGMTFCGSDKHVEGLIFAGVDIANFANNHMGNQGEEGVKNTAQLLKANNILVTGINGPVFKEVKGMRFAFLGYNDIENPSDILSQATEDKIAKEVSDTRKKADVVIVTFHWGTEYVTQPNERQKMLAHLAIDSGADLIIGNHPHWIQPIEIYKEKLITYAHGNFIFDQMWSEETKEGVIGIYKFYNNKLIDVKFLPIFIEDYGQPHLLENDQAKRIIEKMQKASLDLKNEIK